MSNTNLDLRPISSIAGVEVLGVDLRRPVTEDVQRSLREAWHHHALLLFRNQELSEEDQLRAARIFGEISTEGEYGDQNYVSNVIPDGLTPHGELAFHVDHSWSDNPLRGLMLYAIEAPPAGSGGETKFANVKLAYELLPPHVQARIANLQIVHTYPDQNKHVPIPGPDPRPGMPTSTHPLVFPHPVTGEKLLFCSPRHFDRIVGLSADEGLALAHELTGYIDRPEVVYTHVWHPGDLVVWDNLQLQHARTNFDRAYRRHLRRTQIGMPAAVTA
ncbi:TauD/TfdA family dioxygenase [bacterium]|nr:MAG: TauD/TfdA family dioxygenase [bacterium]